MQERKKAQAMDYYCFNFTIPTQAKSCEFKLLDCYLIKENNEFVAITQLTEKPNSLSDTVSDVISGLYSFFSNKSTFYSASIIGHTRSKAGLLTLPCKFTHIMVADEEELNAQQRKLTNAIHFYNHEERIGKSDIFVSIVISHRLGESDKISEEAYVELPKYEFRDTAIASVAGKKPSVSVETKMEPVIAKEQTQRQLGR